MTSLTGFWRLVRFTLRRDRVRLLVWIGAIATLTVVSAGSLPELYPTQRSIHVYVELFGDNPALIAFGGPGYGFDDPNIGLVLVNETQLNGIIALALMSIFLVNRHTRAEEDSERAEMIRSSVVGRHAPTAAATTVIAAANVVVGILCALGFFAFGYQVSGSIALAGSMACAGLIFTGIAAVVAQLTNSGRGTLAVSSAVLAAAFIIRAIGDVADNGISWLSPIGIAQTVQAYADERWWTLGLCLVVTGGLIAGAFWLSTRRDLGSGLVPPKPGRDRAPRWMSRPFGLAFRLQRASLLGWVAAMFLMGYLFGVIAGDIERMLEENDMMADMFSLAGGASITDSYLGSSMVIVGLMAAGFAVSSALRLATEENATRAEPILATSTSRRRWALSHIAVAAGGSVAVMAAAGLGAGVAWAPLADDAGQVPRLLAASLVSVPAIFVMLGVTVALFGVSPSAARGAWAVFGVALAIGMFGTILQLPEWMMMASPFEHVPAFPAEDVRGLPLAILMLLGGGAVAFGLWAFERRDLRTE